MYISEIREMEYIYQKDHPQKVLYLEIDEEEDCIICIIDRGGHPCTYIKIPEEAYQRNVELGWDGDGEFIDVWVHGGVTYSDYGTLRFYPLGRDTEPTEIAHFGYWFGWDYAHLDDYVADYSISECDHDLEKKWTIVELINEAHGALKELKNNDWHVFANNKEENG